MLSDDEDDRRFAELAARTFGNRIAPQLLALHAAGKHEEAQKLLDEATERERALRIAPREVNP